MTQRFQIYAAPRAADGRYRFCDEQYIYIKSFSTLEAMRAYWNDAVLTNTSTTFGLQYELSMVVTDESGWGFIGDPRYADKPVLMGKKVKGSFVVES